MADLCNYKIFKNSNFEVLTPDGYKDFKGIIVGENINKLLVKFSNGKQLICTPKHKIVVDENLNYIYAKDLKVNDLIFNNVKVESISPYNNNELVYELLHVSDNHTYYTNGILSKNCLVLDELAFIPNNLVDDFWKSVYPIISSSKKSKIFIASTPNGTDNLFYKLYIDGLNKKSNWVAEKMLWDEIPGRDEQWKQDTIRSLGSTEAFEQEFNCVSQNTVIDLNINNRVVSMTIAELERYLEENNETK